MIDLTVDDKETVVHACAGGSQFGLAAGFPSLPMSSKMEHVLLSSSSPLE